MKDPVKVLVVAINGYGHYYLKTLLEETDCEKAVLAGVVDPEAERSKYVSTLREFGIPVCSRMNDFYLAGGKADLAVISSPPHFHAPQSILALHHGTNVLCEKPVCSTLADAESIIEKSRKTGKFVMIGYQWSYSDGIQLLKKDTLSGRFGKPLRMKSMCLWPRDFAYFGRNSWAYRKADPEGNMVNDNLFNNAMSHFIHNMFFLTGNSMDSSSEPFNVEVQSARAYPVETYDTGAFMAKTGSGVELLFLGSHAAEKTVDPCFRMEFEKGYIELRPGADRIIVKMSGENEFTYPSPDSSHQFRKLFKAIENSDKGGDPVCTVEAALPQLKLTAAVDRSDRKVTVFSEKQITRTGSRLYVNGLDETLIECYRNFTLIPENIFR
ncbi:MAG: Gfo/Idh/MocA family oxidoreductase [Bacteroidales bacterium]|jgi:predicted dehydrogenase